MNQNNNIDNDKNGKTNKNEIKKRIAAVREIMAQSGIDVYLVCTGDYHMSEYAGEYFAERKYLSGFTGSAGDIVITKNGAALFTDGRYFVQAEKELEGTGIELMRMGCAGVPDIMDYCVDAVPCGGRLGMDGRTVSARMGIELEEALEKKQAVLDWGFNAVEKIWYDRPKFPMSKAYELVAGEGCGCKLERVRTAMEEAGADCHIIASLDDICWLFNIRGADVACNPVIMSYALITENEVQLYADAERFDKELIEKLQLNSVKITAYNKIYEDCERLCKESDVLLGEEYGTAPEEGGRAALENGRRAVLENDRNTRTVLLDTKRVNYALYKSIQQLTVVDKTNPTVYMKAVKNEKEIANLKSVHIEDGLAVTRFIYWVKKQVAAGEKIYTEAEAAKYLDSLRADIKDYIELSFDTICAYGANAAMMHYHAGDDSSVLKPEGMLLVDSGGQYMRGTTDVTRTFALGKVTEQMKRHYTLTLKGMLALADAHFLQGCSGYSLDVLARQYLWEEGIDYRCGTGHGVGYLLNVHEAPNSFRWKYVPGANEWCSLRAGMVTSDEPGVYIDNEYGIRIENEILCVEDRTNEYGTFLKFEMLTCVPFDRELIDINLLENKDKERLNRYNQWVYNSLKDMLDGDELEFLRYETELIS